MPLTLPIFSIAVSHHDLVFNNREMDQTPKRGPREVTWPSHSQVPKNDFTVEPFLLGIRSIDKLSKPSYDPSIDRKEASNLVRLRP